MAEPEKEINVAIREAIHVKVRRLSNSTGIKIKALVEEALTAYLKARKAT